MKLFSRTGLITISVLLFTLGGPMLGVVAAWFICLLLGGGNREALQLGWLFAIFTVPAFTFAGPFIGWFFGYWVAGRIVGPPIIEGDEVRPLRLVSVRATIIRKAQWILLSDGRQLWFKPGDLRLVATASFDSGMPRQCQLKNPREADDILEFDFVAIAPKGHSTMKAIGTFDNRLRLFETDYPTIKSIRVFDGSGRSITEAING